MRGREDSKSLISNQTYAALRSQHKEIVDIDKKAKEAGMTYGQYVALQYLNKQPKGEFS